MCLCVYHAKKSELLNKKEKKIQEEQRKGQWQQKTFTIISSLVCLNSFKNLQMAYFLCTYLMEKIFTSKEKHFAGDQMYTVAKAFLNLHESLSI